MLRCKDCQIPLLGLPDPNYRYSLIPQPLTTSLRKINCIVSLVRDWVLWITHVLVSYRKRDHCNSYELLCVLSYQQNLTTTEELIWLSSEHFDISLKLVEVDMLTHRLDEQSD